jgi:hypothetical protein
MVCMVKNKMSLITFFKLCVICFREICRVMCRKCVVEYTKGRWTSFWKFIYGDAEWNLQFSPRLSWLYEWLSSVYCSVCISRSVFKKISWKVKCLIYMCGVCVVHLPRMQSSKISIQPQWNELLPISCHCVKHEKWCVQCVTQHAQWWPVVSFLMWYTTVCVLDSQTSRLICVSR